MIWVLVICGYVLGVAFLGWVESKLLSALNLGNRVSGMIYATITNLICSVVSPVAAVACVAAGLLGVMGAINNTKGITGQEAFNSFAMPLAIIALVMIVVVRVLPLVLMNLRSPFKALLYSILSTAVLAVLFTFTGIALMTTLSEPAPPAAMPSSP